MIKGRYVLDDLGIDLSFKNNAIILDDGEVPMKSPDFTLETSFFAQEPKNVLGDLERLTKILDAKYSKANLEEIVGVNVNPTKFSYGMCMICSPDRWSVGLPPLVRPVNHEALQ
jgi:hypothetical protein